MPNHRVCFSDECVRFRWERSGKRIAARSRAAATITNAMITRAARILEYHGVDGDEADEIACEALIAALTPDD